jgi:hypothetical protein
LDNNSIGSNNEIDIAASLEVVVDLVERGVVRITENLANSRSWNWNDHDRLTFSSGGIESESFVTLAHSSDSSSGSFLDHTNLIAKRASTRNKIRSVRIARAASTKQARFFREFALASQDRSSHSFTAKASKGESSVTLLNDIADLVLAIANHSTTIIFINTFIRVSWIGFESIIADASTIG